uniref:DUF4220 domain-containing protein n=1 Tax=Leersia perrieri TaxID=77586 RepID=A0A0D9W227_9ORYZ
MITIGSTRQEQQLATLWVAFFLLHAGFPDNITAYALEDNVLSFRQRIDVFFLMIGSVSPTYIFLKNTFLTKGDSMLGVSSLICLMAIAKYLEGTICASIRSNMENMRSSSKKKKKPTRVTIYPNLSRRRGGRELDDEQILLHAHAMLNITKGAFIDDSLNGLDDNDELDRT